MQGGNEYEIFMGNDRKKYLEREAQDGTFLSANVLLWSVTTFIVGMFFCTAIGKIALIDCIANVMCLLFMPERSAERSVDFISDTQT